MQPITAAEDAKYNSLHDLKQCFAAQKTIISVNYVVNYVFLDCTIINGLKYRSKPFRSSVCLFLKWKRKTKGKTIDFRIRLLISAICMN